MAQNDRYRERVELSDEAMAAAEQPMSDLRVRLETLRTEGDISIDAVEGALREVGLPDVVVRGDADAVEFGVDAPEGGCVFGEVQPDSVRVEAGGYIMDGGCLPAQRVWTRLVAGASSPFCVTRCVPMRPGVACRG